MTGIVGAAAVYDLAASIGSAVSTDSERVHSMRKMKIRSSVAPDKNPKGKDAQSNYHTIAS